MFNLDSLSLGEYLNNFNIDEDDLIETFSEYGQVRDAFITQDEDGCSRGFTFVTMRKVEDSKKVMDALNSKEDFRCKL